MNLGSKNGDQLPTLTLHFLSSPPPLGLKLLQTSSGFTTSSFCPWFSIARPPSWWICGWFQGNQAPLHTREPSSIWECCSSYVLPNPFLSSLLWPNFPFHSGSLFLCSHPLPMKLIEITFFLKIKIKKHIIKKKDITKNTKEKISPVQKVGKDKKK